MTPTPKFGIGDPVWARSLIGDVQWGFTPGERPAVVTASFFDCFRGEFVYDLDILRPIHEGLWRECGLRPRRDDYQQHEPLGSRADLDKPVTPDLSEDSIEELLEIRT